MFGELKKRSDVSEYTLSLRRLEFVATGVDGVEACEKSPLSSWSRVEVSHPR